MFSLQLRMGRDKAKVTMTGKKNGTAEINKGSEETHAWFVGFAPAKEPKVAVAIFVERGGVRGEVAVRES